MEGRRSYKQNWLNWEEEEMSMLQLARKRMWAVLQVEERRRKILINLTQRAQEEGDHTTVITFTLTTITLTTITLTTITLTAITITLIEI